MPSENAATDSAHDLDEKKADDREFEQAGENADGIRKSPGFHHGAAEASAAQHHFGNDGDNQGDRERNFYAAENLGRGRREYGCVPKVMFASAEIAR